VIDEGTLLELIQQVSTRRISSVDLGNRLSELADADQSFLPKIAATGLTAIKQKRYQTPEVFAGLGSLFYHLAKTQEQQEERSQMTKRSIAFLKKVFEKDNMHAAAWSTLGQVYALTAKADQALQCHERARKAAVVYKGNLNRSRIFARYGACLKQRADQLIQDGSLETGNTMLAQAKEQLTAALEAGAMNPLKEQCQALLDAIDDSSKSN